MNKTKKSYHSFFRFFNRKVHKGFTKRAQRRVATDCTDFFNHRVHKGFHREHKEKLPQIAQITKKNQPQSSQRKVATDC
ncbi:MAG: hypothetical protein WCI53_07660, partial [Bacteroidota bacterium]